MEAAAALRGGTAIEGEAVDEMDIRGVQAKRAANRSCSNLNRGLLP